jgi:hypothetical protein
MDIVYLRKKHLLNLIVKELQLYLKLQRSQLQDKLS